jgi:hypothetical protein
MVNMSMSKHYVIDLSGIDSQLPVHGISFKTFSLVHTAIEKDFLSQIGCNQMLTASNFTGRA